MNRGLGFRGCGTRYVQKRTDGKTTEHGGAACTPGFPRPQCRGPWGSVADEEKCLHLGSTSRAETVGITPWQSTLTTGSMGLERPHDAFQLYMRRALGYELHRRMSHRISKKHRRRPLRGREHKNHERAPPGGQLRAHNKTLMPPGVGQEKPPLEGPVPWPYRTATRFL